MYAFPEASVGTSKDFRPPTDERPKGPFLPDGREICRSFNYNPCFRVDCRMMHICFSSALSALNGNSGHSQPKPKNLDVPQIRN